MSDALLLLACARDLLVRPDAHILLLGRASGQLALALAELLSLFSADSRFFGAAGAFDESMPAGSYAVALSQQVEELHLPKGFFDIVVLIDADNSSPLPARIVSEAIDSLCVGGGMHLLSAWNEVQEAVTKEFLELERIDIASDARNLVLLQRRLVQPCYEELYGMPYQDFMSQQISSVKKKYVTVFLPCTMADWEQMEPFYRHELERKEETTALVMPIPYARKDELENPGEWQYEGKQIRQTVPIVSWGELSLEKLHPDTLVVAHAYHGEHPELIWLEQHFASRLTDLTDKLVCLADRLDWRRAHLGGADAYGDWMTWRGYILYGGATWEAEKFYFQIPWRDEILYFASNSAGGEFHGHRILALQDIPHWQDYMILVATNWPAYGGIKHEFEQQGLIEFQDFCYAEAYHKKIAMIHGNCYAAAYEEFLLRSQCFTEEYFIYRVPMIFVNEAKRYEDRLLEAIDLLIYQDVKKDNPFGFYLSDEYILPKLKPGCKRLLVPNLTPFADMLFPRFLSTESPKKKYTNCVQDGLYNGDKLIDDGFLAGKSLAQIKVDFENENILTPEECRSVQEHLQERLARLKEREAAWDVKISDYIEENYKTSKMFVDFLHPSYELTQELCRRVGEALGLADAREIQVDMDYEMVEMFVLPAVKKALGLTFEQKYVRTHNRLNWPNRDKLGDGRLDLEGYIREYVFWKYGKFIF